MGGPFAVAAAAHLGDRAERLVLAGGLPPLDDREVFAGLDAFNRRLYTVASRAPWLLPLLLRRMVARRHRDPDGFHRDYYADAPAADAAAAADPQLGAMLRASQLEAVAAGVGGLAREIVLVARPWGLDAGAVTAPAVYLSGTDDRVVGAGAAAAYRAVIGDALDVVPVEGAGHLIPLTHWPAMLEAISPGGLGSPAPGAPPRAR
jgi:pimeloyl-ACP methyl ester carboxylesterase